MINLSCSARRSSGFAFKLNGFAFSRIFKFTLEFAFKSREEFSWESITFWIGFATVDSTEICWSTWRPEFGFIRFAPFDGSISRGGSTRIWSWMSFAAGALSLITLKLMPSWFTAENFVVYLLYVTLNLRWLNECMNNFSKFIHLLPQNTEMSFFSLIRLEIFTLYLSNINLRCLPFYRR